MSDESTSKAVKKNETNKHVSGENWISLNGFLRLDPSSEDSKVKMLNFTAKTDRFQSVVVNTFGWQANWVVSLSGAPDC